LQNHNFTIKELFDYKITEIKINDEDDNSEFSDYNDTFNYEDEEINGVKRKISFNEKDSPDKKITNSVDHQYFFNDKNLKLSNKIILTKKNKETNIGDSLIDSKLNEREGSIITISNLSDRKQKRKSLVRKNINLDLLTDITSIKLNEESNPINVNNLTNSSIDEMITNHADVLNNSKNLRASFINNIRSSIDSKNISSIVNKLNPPILKDNTDFRSSFIESYNNPFK